MARDEAKFTIMAVHAHPDDEVVFTGGTLALYHQRGARTVLVTATSGEEGEIHDPDLDPDEARPRLGQIRREELRRAAHILNIDHLELLGYRDSGMAGTEANKRPDNFLNADLDEATDRLVQLVRRYRPHVLITYDENGAYGHPDHIKCNLITLLAFEKAADPAYQPTSGEPWQPMKLYYTHWPEDRWALARQMYIERGLKWPWDEDQAAQQVQDAKSDSDPEHQSTEEGVAELQQGLEQAREEGKSPPYVPPLVTTRINVLPVMTLKREAMKVHRTQFSMDGVFLTTPEDIIEVAFGEEQYSLMQSHVPTSAQEDDLLAGLAPES